MVRFLSEGNKNTNAPSVVKGVNVTSAASSLDPTDTFPKMLPFSVWVHKFPGAVLNVSVGFSVTASVPKGRKHRPSTYNSPPDCGVDCGQQVIKLTGAAMMMMMEDTVAVRVSVCVKGGMDV